MTHADLLMAAETCQLKGLWSRDWGKYRLTANEMLQRALHAGLTTEEEDCGEHAGQTIMDLAVTPGMEMPSSHYLHDSVVHHAALADVLTVALRGGSGQGRWLRGVTTSLRGAPWASSALIAPSGSRLRRVVLASSWNDSRHYSEIRSWYGLGEVAIQNLPMTMAVVVLGQHRDGRRSGAWTRGFLHPQNHKLRFRKKSKVTFESFADTWKKVWREERGEITTKAWLQAMLDDDILRDVCFTVDIDVPSAPEVERIRDMAARKLERVMAMTELPEASMSVCDRPPCKFKECCWSAEPYVPSKRAGFVPVGEIGGNLGGTPTGFGGLWRDTLG